MQVWSWWLQSKVEEETVTAPQVARKPRRKIMELVRRHKVRFWGRNYVITPRLVDWIHGDGLQVIYFMPLNTRPNYYVVRIGSKVSLNNSDELSFADEVLGDLYGEIEDQFGCSQEEWEHDNGRTYRRQNPWPALSEDNGSCWGLLAMLKELR
jgi:hypothetical protein